MVFRHHLLFSHVLYFVVTFLFSGCFIYVLMESYFMFAPTMLVDVGCSVRARDRYPRVVFFTVSY